MPTDASPLIPASADPTEDEPFDLSSYLHSRSELQRTRLARRLHDDLGTMLTAAAIDAVWAEGQVQTLSDYRLAERLKRMRLTLGAAIDLNRAMVEELRPTLLDNFGLLAACRWYLKQCCERPALPYSQQYPQDEPRLAPLMATGLFRLFQECLAVTFAEPCLKGLQVEFLSADNALSINLSHVHEELETTDVFVDLPGPMCSIVHRTKALGGSVEVIRGAIGSRIAMSFPLP